LTNFTLPAGLASLTSLNLNGNPLTTFVLPDPLATSSLAVTVASLKSHGVSVYTYPLDGGLSLASPQRTTTGGFGFALTGPLAVYTILTSTDLAAWSPLGTITNTLGAVVFTDVEGTNLVFQKFLPHEEVRNARGVEDFKGNRPLEN